MVHSLYAGQRDCIFGTRLDAQTTSLTCLRIYEQRLLPPVSQAFDLSPEAQTRSLFLRQRAHCIYRDRANSHALGFSFATISVDDWPVRSGFLLAFCGTSQDGYSMRLGLTPCINCVVEPSAACACWLAVLIRYAPKSGCQYFRRRQSSAAESLL